MDYEKCWNNLKERVSNGLKKAQEDNYGWISVMTMETLEELIRVIEREVQNDK